MSQPPRVSVCVPSYNHSQFLSQTLDSILGQTFTDLEIIIVDDGSTDGSFEIAQRYASNHPTQISLHTHSFHQNRGISATVNTAFQIVRGEYWMGIPSDDLLHANKIERQVNFLDQHEDIGWVYSHANFIDDEGRLLEGLFGADITKDPDPVETLIQGNQIPGMTALMRRSVSERVGLHHTSLLYSDWHYWIRMAASSKVGFIAEPLVDYRLHSNNTSIGVETCKNIERFVEVTKVIRDDINNGSIRVNGDRTRALLELQMAYYYFCLDDNVNATSSLRSAVSIDPGLLTDPNYLRNWINGRCALSSGLFKKPEKPSELVDWLLTSMRGSISPLTTKRLEAEYLAQVAIESLDTDPSKTREFAFKSVVRDPHQLTNKVLQRTWIKGIAGERVISQLRKLKSKR